MFKVVSAFFLSLVACVALANESADVNYAEKINAAYQNQDIEKATRLLTEWADSGNPRALYNLASNYERGIGVQQDPVKAFNLMKKAAMGGYAKAYINLSAYYFSGFGTPVNLDSALDWRAKSATEGNIESIQLLAYSFFTGSGLTKTINKPQAIEWLKSGAALNDNFSIYCMGMLHYLGEAGYAKDYEKAKTYWDTLGEESATVYINMLEEGFRNGTLGLDKDTARAEYWSKVQKRQLSKIEQKMGSDKVYPAGYFQTYQNELKIISDMLPQI